MARNTRLGRSPLPEWAWRRHANPWSGWTRFATTPFLVAAAYQRDWRLVGLLVGWLILNPVAFSQPETTDAWMTRVVLAEREWIATGHGTVGPTWPNVLNLLNLPTALYLGVAVARRSPVHTSLATALLMGLKLWWVAEIVEATGIPTGERFADY